MSTRAEQLKQIEESLRTWRAMLSEAETRAAVAEAEAASAKNWLEAVRQTVAGHESARALLTPEADGPTYRHDLEISDVETGARTVVEFKSNHEGTHIRGREAIRRLLSESAHKEWSQREIVQKIMERGWVDPDSKDPEAAIRVTVRRMAEKNRKNPPELEQVGFGVYKLLPDTSGSEAAAADAGSAQLGWEGGDDGSGAA